MAAATEKSKTFAELFADLGIELGNRRPEDVPKDEIKKGYRKQAQLHHPDKFRDPAEKLAKTEILKSVNSAYSILKDETKIQEYRNHLAREEGVIRRAAEAAAASARPQANAGARPSSSGAASGGRSSGGASHGSNGAGAHNGSRASSSSGSAGRSSSSHRPSPSAISAKEYGEIGAIVAISLVGIGAVGYWLNEKMKNSHRAPDQTVQNKHTFAEAVRTQQPQVAAQFNR